MNTTSSMPRFFQMYNWIFEVKMVRALRVERYGDPYTAVANLTATGDNIYIDSQMTREGEEFTRKDFFTFYNFCRMLEMKAVNYDKIKNGERYQRTVHIRENIAPAPQIRLVK